MSIAVITGSAGLIGSEAARHFASLGLEVVGIDNDMRRVFFGDEASTAWQRRRLEKDLSGRYRHHDIDIRDREAVEGLFRRLSRSLGLVVHAAAQPSHDWAASDPHADFGVNAVGTLNLLEATRQHAPDAVFVFTSTNKVYGDTPNSLPLIEQETRWEIDPAHPYAGGIPETMPIDHTLHSLFGASKVAADVLVQEYGRYFGLRTGVFRGGCLTGPNHSPSKLHGFLAYLMKCTAAGTPYTVFGYQGKQVRDNIHSADLITAFDFFFRAPVRCITWAAGGSVTAQCSRPSPFARRWPGGSWSGRTARATVRATTSGTSATWASSSRTTPLGGCGTTCGPSARPSTRPTPTIGGAERAGVLAEHLPVQKRKRRRIDLLSMNDRAPNWLESRRDYRVPHRRLDQFSIETRSNRLSARTTSSLDLACLNSLPHSCRSPIALKQAAQGLIADDFTDCCQDRFACRRVSEGHMPTSRCGRFQWSNVALSRSAVNSRV
jgi:CDP-paratose 2-epimerase